MARFIAVVKLKIKRLEAFLLLYFVERMLEEYNEQTNQDLQKRIQKRVDVLRSTLKGDDMEDIRKKEEQLSQEIRGVGKEI